MAETAVVDGSATVSDDRAKIADLWNAFDKARPPRRNIGKAPASWSPIPT